MVMGYDPGSVVLPTLIEMDIVVVFPETLVLPTLAVSPVGALTVTITALAAPSSRVTCAATVV